MRNLTTAMTIFLGLWLCRSAAAQAPGTVVIDDFATGRGHFTSAVDAGPATGGFFPATSSVPTTRLSDMPPPALSGSSSMTTPLSTSGPSTPGG